MIHKEVNKPKLDINRENIDLTSIIERERIEFTLKLKESVESYRTRFCINGQQRV